jgi:hypothetical protein
MSAWEEEEEEEEEENEKKEKQRGGSRKWRVNEDSGADGVDTRGAEGTEGNEILT